MSVAGSNAVQAVEALAGELGDERANRSHAEAQLRDAYVKIDRLEKDNALMAPTPLKPTWGLVVSGAYAQIDRLEKDVKSLRATEADWRAKVKQEAATAAVLRDANESLKRVHVFDLATIKNLRAENATLRSALGYDQARAARAETEEVRHELERAKQEVERLAYARAELQAQNERLRIVRGDIQRLQLEPTYSDYDYGVRVRRGLANISDYLKEIT